MDELQLVMEDATGDQGVFLGGFQPIQQIPHQLRNPLRRRCDMDDLLILENTDPAPAKHARFIHQTRHQKAMRG